MTTAIQIPPNGNIPSASFQEIPLICIPESRTNPRRQFDEPSLTELAANIRQHGVLQPVLVRPLPEGEPGAFELVAGARRYRASKLAGRESILATIRELTDTQCLELQLIELSVVARVFLLNGSSARRLHVNDVLGFLIRAQFLHCRPPAQSGDLGQFTGYLPSLGLGGQREPRSWVPA
jgi:ParB-like nuclease domain